MVSLLSLVCRSCVLRCVVVLLMSRRFSWIVSRLLKGRFVCCCSRCMLIWLVIWSCC